MSELNKIWESFFFFVAELLIHEPRESLGKTLDYFRNFQLLTHAYVFFTAISNSLFKHVYLYQYCDLSF
jgi:hypothetical protein